MIGLTKATAERIRRQLDRSPGNSQTIGTGRWRGHRPFVVRCTSATAAAVSGVGAQCYAGVIVDLDPAATSQSDLGEVWLTLYDGGGNPVRPRAGKHYTCLVQGDVEAATGDTRPRAFGVSGGDISDAACKSFLTLPQCATLEVVEVYGSCACITTGQTASLTRSGAALVSDDLLYGCPPGVTTATFCDGGSAPRLYSFTLAGLTGDCSVMNGGWTVAYTTGNTWVGTRGGYTATLTLSSTTSGTLTFTDAESSEVLVYTIEGFDCCSAITTAERDAWTCDDPPASVTATPATACGNGPAYTPYLTIEQDTCGDCLKLLWIPVAGSGAASVKWKLVGCGVDGDGKPYAEFASASSLVCTDDVEECGENSVVVRVTCRECNPLCDCEESIEWTSSGWYCVSGTCTEYTIAPAGEEVLCYGPFASQSECQTSITAPECVGCEVMPRDICLTLESTTTPAFLDGVRVPLVWVAANGQWEWTGSIVEALGNDVDGEWALEYVYVSFVGAGCGGLEINIGGTSYSAAFPEGRPWGSNLAGGDNGGLDDTVCDFVAAESSTWSGLDVGAAGVYQGSFEGTLSFESPCEVAPTPTTYNCVNGTCVEVYDGSGEYATSAECETACTGGGGGTGTDDCCGITPGDSVRLIIVDGADAGTYNSTWYESGGFLYADFKGGEYRMACGLTGPGSLSLSNFPPGHTGFGAATSFSCGPFAATFPLSVGPSGTTSISAMQP